MRIDDPWLLLSLSPPDWSGAPVDCVNSTLDCTDELIEDGIILLSLQMLHTV